MGEAPADILERLAEWNPEAVLWDGLDEAVVGIGGRVNLGPVAIYDREKCIKILAGQEMSWEEAEEYFSFNVEGAYVGEYTPIIGV
mgnify:CR=1 FL=1